MKKIALSLLFPLFLIPVKASVTPAEIITTCNIQAGGKLCWSAKENSVQVIYLVQQFRWNKWVNWDTIQGDAASDSAYYSVAIQKYLHSGQNVFRVCPFAEGMVLKYSPKVYYNGEDRGDILVRAFYPSASDTLVEFKEETCYELYNKSGEIVRQGYGKSFSRKGLDGDVYYLNYDNKTSEVMWNIRVD